MAANNKFDFNKQFSNMMNYFQFLDMNNFKDIINENIGALNAANQVVMEGFQNAYKKQTESAQHFAQKSFECVKNCSSNPNIQDMQKSHANLAQEFVENMTSNTREMVEKSSKAMLEVFDIGAKMASKMAKESCAFASNSGSK